jgi:hypothetical protein
MGPWHSSSSAPSMGTLKSDNVSWKPIGASAATARFQSPANPETSSTSGPRRECAREMASRCGLPATSGSSTPGATCSMRVPTVTAGASATFSHSRTQGPEPMRSVMRGAPWEKSHYCWTPAAEDPEGYIEFNGERALPRGGARRGRVTIDVIGLNRTKLSTERRDKLEQVRLQFDGLRLMRAGIIRVDNPEGQGYLRRVCRAILAAAEPRAPFAGMMRCALREWLAPEVGFPCSEETLSAWALAGAEKASK